MPNKILVEKQFWYYLTHCWILFNPLISAAHLAWIGIYIYKNPTSKFSEHDTKTSDGKAPVLEIRGM